MLRINSWFVNFLHEEAASARLIVARSSTETLFNSDLMHSYPRGPGRLLIKCCVTVLIITRLSL